MACAYCDQEGYPAIPHAGQCSYGTCTLHVCTRPPKRAYGKYHGEFCHCDCSRLICIRDMIPHVRDDHAGQDPRRCFRRLWLLWTDAIARSSGVALVSGRTEGRAEEETVTAMNQFVNYFSPGTEDLLNVVPDLDPDQFNVEADDDRWFVRFGPEFYSEGTVERIFVLALNELAGVLEIRATDQLDDLQLVAPASAEWIDTFSSAWRTGDLERSDLKRYAPSDQPDGAVRLLSVVATTRAPVTASDLAAWLVEDRIPVY